MRDLPRSRAFVGRAAELAEFAQAIDDAREHFPSTVLVGGPAGIGKSRLVAEAVRQAGVASFLGRCVHIAGESIPLAPVVDLVRRIRRQWPEPLLEEPAFSVLADLLDPDKPSGAANPPEEATLLFPLLELVERLSRDGVAVLGFEDLHWADALTWDVLEFLARNLVDEKVVLVGTYRTQDAGLGAAQRLRLAELSRIPGVRHLHLSALTRSDTADLMTGMLGARPTDPMLDEIVSRGQGNPFFTEELVAAQAAGESIPALLSDLISGEIAALQDDARLVVDLVATVGRETSHDLLARASGLDEAQLEPALRSALDAQVIVMEPGGDSYRLRHPLLGEVAISRLLVPERRRLHRRVANALGAGGDYRGMPAGIAGEIAFHLDRTGDHQAAFGAYLAAARSAVVLAPAAALSHFERALELWDSAGDAAAGEDKLAATWQAAELAGNTGDPERAVALARSALAGGEPPKGEAWGHERLARYLWIAGRLEESSAEYERANSLLPPDSRSSEAASVLAGLAQADYLFCRYQSAERSCRRALEIVPTPESGRQVWLHAKRVLGMALASLGATSEPVELCRQAAEAAVIAEDRAITAIYLCEALMDAGRFEEAATRALDGAAEGQLAGLDLSMGGYLSVVAADCLIRLGRWSEATSVLARCEGLQLIPVTACRYGVAAATLAARRGDRESAEAALAIAEVQPVDPWHRMRLLLASAEVGLLTGNPARAERVARRAWEFECSKDRRMPALVARLIVAAAVENAMDARAKRETVDLPRLRTALQELVTEAREACTTEDGGIGARQEAHLGTAEASIGRLADNDPAAWANAAGLWERLRDPWAAASARLAEAEAAALAGQADRAATALRIAHEAAQRLDARGLATEVEALSRRARISVDLVAEVPLGPDAADRLGLTPREVEVLSLVAAGSTNRQIAEALYVSDKTVSVHVSNILRKLGVTSRVEAAAIAQRLDIA